MSQLTVTHPKDELWKASGWHRDRHRKVAYRIPFPPEGHDSKVGPEPQGPTLELSFYPFPIQDYVLFLLREGRLTASGSVPSEALGRALPLPAGQASSWLVGRVTVS